MKTLRTMLFFVLLLLIVGLACSFGAGETPTPLPIHLMFKKFSVEKNASLK